MIFSDNVTRKPNWAPQYAREVDLMVMGPDCGNLDRQRYPTRLRQRGATRTDRRRRRIRDRYPGGDRPRIRTARGSRRR